MAFCGPVRWRVEAVVVRRRKVENNHMQTVRRILQLQCAVRPASKEKFIQIKRRALHLKANQSPSPPPKLSESLFPYSLLSHETNNFRAEQQSCWGRPNIAVAFVLPAERRPR